MTFHRQILWVDQRVPIIASLPQSSYTLLLNEWRMYPSMLSILEGGTAEGLEVYNATALCVSEFHSLDLGHQLFWRTRVKPEWVPARQLEILVRKLTPNPPPLFISDKIHVICSATREVPQCPTQPIKFSKQNHASSS
jgi:hypothetical protein